MNLAQIVVYSPLRALTRTLCRVHDEELARIPRTGPLLIVANHVNFLDAPIFYTHLIPRDVTGFAKIETWKNPAICFLFTLGGAIPIRRGVVDRTAIGLAREVLRSGRILAVYAFHAGSACIAARHASRWFRSSYAHMWTTMFCGPISGV